MFFQESYVRTEKYPYYYIFWQDASDFEWETWNRKFVLTVAYAYAAHFFLMRLAEKFCHQHRFLVSMLFCFFFGVCYFGIFPCMVLMLQSLMLFLVAHFTHQLTFCWLWSVVFIIIFTSSYTVDKLYTMLEEDPHLLWTYTCTVSMHVVRCTGFAVELCWSQKHIAKQEKSSSLLKNRQAMQSNQYHFFSSFYKLLEYQFYFPLFISGPIVNYNEFKNQVDKNLSMTWNATFAAKFAVGIAKFLFYHYVLNIILYFMLFTGINADLELCNRLPLGTLCGLLLCSGQFFCMKYIVIYGFSAQYAVSDNLDVPGAPRCIMIFHRFTDTWRHFDLGAYRWLVRYIYIPLGGSRDRGHVRRMLNSMIPFAFILVWHGSSKNFVVWAALNWFGVFVEKLASDLYELELVRKFENQYLSPTWSRRLRGALKSPVYGALMISNLFFVGGYDIAMLYVRRLYTEDLAATVMFHIFLYCGVQTSMELDRFG